MIRGQLTTMLRGWGLALLATGGLGVAGAAEPPPPFSPVPATPAEGRVEHILVHGRSLEGNLGGESADRKVAVYLPPSYDRAPRRRYPVLYLLHAFSALGNGLEETYYGLRGQPIPAIWAQWVANSPLWMIPQYLPALRGYRGLAIDVGDRDQFGGIPDSVRALDATLRQHGVPHSVEIYAGDHADQIDSRFSGNVLPFFAKHLQPQ